MGRTTNTLPRFDTNLQEGDQISASQWNALANLLNGIKAFDGIWIKATATGLHIGGGGGVFPWKLLSFGFSLVYDADAEETTCTIYPGDVIMHHMRTYTLAASADVVLSGATAIVHAVMDRMGSSPDIEIACDTVAESTGSQMKIPLYTFTEKGAGRYALARIHNMGDVNFSAPVR